jgi:hypothetical protein
MSKDFPEMEYKPVAEVITLPEGIDALRLLQMEYRGEIVLTYAQRRAAEACLPFERPKLGVMATTNLTSEDFSAMLERAIARSQVRLIEHRADEGAKPSPPPPDKRFRR